MVPTFTAYRSVRSAPSYTPAASPRLRRRLSAWPPHRLLEPASELTRLLEPGHVLQSGPYPPGWSRRHHYGASTTGSLALRLLTSLAGPGSSGSADPSRRCRGCFPPSPAIPGSGCRPLHQTRCDGPAVEPFHLHPNTQRLVAHPAADAIPGHCAPAATSRCPARCPHDPARPPTPAAGNPAWHQPPTPNGPDPHQSPAPSTAPTPAQPPAPPAHTATAWIPGDPEPAARWTGAHKQPRGDHNAAARPSPPAAQTAWPERSSRPPPPLPPAGSTGGVIIRPASKPSRHTTSARFTSGNASQHGTRPAGPLTGGHRCVCRHRGPPPSPPPARASRNRRTYATAASRPSIPMRGPCPDSPTYAVWLAP
jgi:hypothetical protein